MDIPNPGCRRWHGSQKCTCPRPWRILKSRRDPKYPWLVSRYTADHRYEPVMRCASYEAATRLLQALIWLSAEQARRTPPVDDEWRDLGWVVNHRDVHQPVDPKE